MARALAGAPATVVMPRTAPLIKVSNTRGYGARVLQKGMLDDATVEARPLVEEEGLVLVHAFDDPRVVPGQGTVGLKIAEHVPDIETVVVAVGGRGLTSGTAIALKSRRPEVRVAGVEAVVVASARASQGPAAW